MNKDDKILVAGATGMVGSIVRNLKAKGYTNILTPDRKRVNYTDQHNTFLYGLC